MIDWRNQPGFQAIVLVTQHLAHLVRQTLGLGKISDGFHGSENMDRLTVSGIGSPVSNGSMDARRTRGTRVLSGRISRVGQNI